MAKKANPEAKALAELKAIAEEAYLYGFPMIVGYKVMYEFNIDRNSGQFRAPFNEINNEARVFTPKDTTISTPNSDTPYSMGQLDLRAEPIVMCMPEIEKARYYDVQLVDMYTDNYGYIGSRTTGNGPGRKIHPRDLSPEMKAALGDGIKAAFAKIEQTTESVGTRVNGWQIASAGGSRDSTRATGRCAPPPPSSASTATARPKPSIRSRATTRAASGSMAANTPTRCPSRPGSRPRSMRSGRSRCMTAAPSY
jgi:hypothetical protein